MKLSTIPFVRGLVAAFTLLALSILPITGCSKSAGSGGADNVELDLPPIYVAQTLVLKEAGEPAVERNYRQLLKACNEAAMATTPLDEKDARKLGRTYFQLWFDDRHTAWQKEVWDFGVSEDSAKPCQFHVKHEATKVVQTSGKTLSIDLMAGTATSEASSGFLPGGGADPGDGVGLDDASAKQAGFQRLGYATDAGQRCLRWRAPKPNEDESCTWSEGRKWGFSPAENGNQATSYDPGAIVLWVHPANGNGGELTTQKMTVGGERFDDDVFAPPSGVSVTKDGP